MALLVKFDFGQRKVTHLLARRQHKRGASLYFQLLPAPLSILQYLPLCYARIEIVGETLHIQTGLLGQFKKNVAHRNATAFSKEGAANSPVQLGSLLRPLPCRALNSLEGRPHRHWPF